MTTLVPAKPAARSRTLLVAVLTIAGGLLQLVVDNLQLSAETNATLLAIAGAVFFVLRLLTTQPVSAAAGEVKEVKP